MLKLALFSWQYTDLTVTRERDLDAEVEAEQERRPPASAAVAAGQDGEGNAELADAGNAVADKEGGNDTPASPKHTEDSV